MTDDALKDPDRLDGVAHPRETAAVFGHAGAERAFLSAWTEGRVHHAWLLRGPPGIGKASFAYRIARFVLSQREIDLSGFFAEPPPPPDSLDAEFDGPDARQIAAGAHPGLKEIRRPFNAKTGKFGKVIAVDDIRALKNFFQLSAAEGGWRVALIDPADDLNIAAANALLKLLEEPPERCLFLLVSSAPGRLPPTILSRCRTLEFRPLSAAQARSAIAKAADPAPEDVDALLRLSPGSPGEALRLDALGGARLYGQVVELFTTLPEIDRRRLHMWLEEIRSADALEGVGRLMRIAFERQARAAALGPEAGLLDGPAEDALGARLGPGAGPARLWAEAATDTFERIDEALRLNLDPRRTILDTALHVEALLRPGFAAPQRG